MTVPSFLNSSYRYLETASVTDVATIISDLRSETVTNGNPAWTEPLANNFKSPPLSDGQFFTVILSSISTTRLGVKITDYFGQTICDRALDIDAGGTTVRIFTGQCHAWIDSGRAAPEGAGGGLVDLAPDTVGLRLYRTFGYGSRDTAGTLDSQTAYYWWMWDNAATALAIRINCGISTVSSYPCKSVGGASVFWPMLAATQIYGSNRRWIGRFYQFLFVPDDLAYGAEVDVPIDSGVTGKFRVIHRGAVASGHWKCAVRKTT